MVKSGLQQSKAGDNKNKLVVHNVSAMQNEKNQNTLFFGGFKPNGYHNITLQFIINLGGIAQEGGFKFSARSPRGVKNLVAQAINPWRRIRAVCQLTQGGAIFYVPAIA